MFFISNQAESKQEKKKIREDFFYPFKTTQGSLSFHFSQDIFWVLVFKRNIDDMPADALQTVLHT